jgi:hypothetical protein
MEEGTWKAYTLQLLNNTRMQILIHIPILQRILRRLIGACHGCIEMLQVLREADAHFEGVHSLLVAAVAAVGYRHAAAVYFGVIVVALERVVELWRSVALGGGSEVVRERHGEVRAVLVCAALYCFGM